MAGTGLPAPEYIETQNKVKLILWNNIDEWADHSNKIPYKASDEALYEALNDALN